MDESNEASRRERTASTEAAPAEVAKPATKRPTGWWRSRTRAQLQVELACLAVIQDGYTPPRRHADYVECVKCPGAASAQHSMECQLGDARSGEEIAREIEGML